MKYIAGLQKEHPWDALYVLLNLARSLSAPQSFSLLAYYNTRFLGFAKGESYTEI